MKITSTHIKLIIYSDFFPIFSKTMFFLSLLNFKHNKHYKK